MRIISVEKMKKMDVKERCDKRCVAMRWSSSESNWDIKRCQ